MAKFVSWIVKVFGCFGASDEVVLLTENRFVGMETGIVVGTVEAVFLSHQVECRTGTGAVVESTGVGGEFGFEWCPKPIEEVAVANVTRIVLMLGVVSLFGLAAEVVL